MMQKMHLELLSLLPVKAPTMELKKSIKLCLQELSQKVNADDLPMFMGQFKTLLKKLNSASKLTCLRDKMHRALLLELICQKGIQFYNYSYFNRAKLTQRHLELLKEVGPYLFVEGVMIVSKMNVIYKNYSRIFIEDHLYQESEDVIDTQIKAILKMCDDKKRSINNNLRKLEHLLGDPDIRVELVKELGKLLRASWKKQKSKNKCVDVLEEMGEKQLVKLKTKDGYQGEEFYECEYEKPQNAIFADYNDYDECVQKHFEENWEAKPKQHVKILFQDVDLGVNNKCESISSSCKKSHVESAKFSLPISLSDWQMKNQRDFQCISLKSHFSSGKSNQDPFGLRCEDLELHNNLLMK